MKFILFIFLLAGSTAFGQMTISDAIAAAGRHKVGSYTYHEQFTGHKGYGAPVIVTNDGGAAVFGDTDDGGLLVRMDSKGNDLWKIEIKPYQDDIESQSVIEDMKGNLYVFMLSYDHSKYRGGCQRAVRIDPDGKILWDKIFSDCMLVNNPLFSYIRLLDDGRLELRGHIVTEHPVGENDPEYHFWEGWLDNEGNLTQKIGEVIDWSKQEWQKFFEPM